MRRIKKVLAVIAGAIMLTSVAALPAEAVPPGCGAANFVSSAPMYYSVAGSTVRIGTLTQYWGNCSGGQRNWAQVDFNAGYSAAGIRVAIQTHDGVLHGAKVHNSGTRFNSDPAATINVSTRGYADGTFFNGGVATLSAVWTPWSG